VPSLVEIGPVVLKKRILNIFCIFLLFSYYLPLERDTTLHLNKLEHPPPNDDLCQFWLKLAQWFWKKRF
jgi:hypothetical protein